ncbi:CopG family transcriptional regulator [Coleofasciculus sp. FACHB-712]|uniref:CopG family transcriptional regulator n=1 Tax=Coleofasciculus sp. FACHB-712 TaxID=2692789 RepID=UPI00168A0D2A|nr:CopG family transcriptional regulator [Coleofasciculus sp. FACHB-712]MBD1944866.1 CopG family transcriptional regulator [Coleofasciculus sp. FACHB-712]
MTKKRKPLDDDDNLAKQFVFQQPTPTPKESSTESKPKEVMVRISADLTQSMYKKLSILAARSGRKKVEIIRTLLEEALRDVKD